MTILINQNYFRFTKIFDSNHVSGLDTGDRQALEQKYSGCDPPCLLDSSDGRSDKNIYNVKYITEV